MRAQILAVAPLVFVLACPSANPPTKAVDAGPDSGTMTSTTTDAAVGADVLEDSDGGLRDSGIEDGGGDDPDGGGSNLLRERSCETVVRYRPTGGRDIFIAGSWDGFSPTSNPMTDPEVDGEYVARLNLEPGLYSYKFVVDGNWLLDPGHKYRAHQDGVENSGLRVPNCREPLIEFVSKSGTQNGAGRGAMSVLVRYTEANGGEGPDPARFALTLKSDGTERPLTAGEMSFNADSWEMTVNLSGLADGKHTISAVMPNTGGTASNNLLVPFWIEADAFDWRDAIIYMVMIDRFRDGTSANNAAPIPEAVPTADFLGGDLQGVTQAIEQGYFDALGVKSIWFTPFNVNPTGAYGDGDGVHSVTGYHGYWPIDPRRVDDRIGGDQALRDMVAAAHRHGIRILADFVINHVHELHPYVTQHPEWFSTLPTGCICGTNGCDWTGRRLDCLFKPYMPDINWMNNDAAETFIADALWWLDEFDLDGFRVDAVKHVPDGAIFNLATRIEEEFERAGTRYFLVGETAMGWGDCDPRDPNCNAENYGTISRYVGEHALDGQFDFVLHHGTALSVFAYENRGMIHADVWTQASQYRYPSGAIMTPYVGSHDESRFTSHVTDPQLAGNKWPEQDLPEQPSSSIAYRRLGLAETWNLTIPGAPLLYYGDEYGEFGASDPDNRHFMRFDQELSVSEEELLTWIRAVGTARLELPALRRGELTSLMSNETFWAYQRAIPASSEFAIVAINRSAMPATQTVSLDARFGISQGASLRDRISGGAVNVPAANTVEIQLGPYSAAIIAP
jgi:glycosidase